MRVTGFTVLVSLIALSSTAPASAQVSAKAWYCAADKMTNPCNGPADCDAQWAAHMARFHPGAGSGTPLTPAVPPTPMGAVLITTATFAGGGTLLGSLGTRDGVNQWKSGLIGGGGTGLVFAAAANANKIPVVVGAALATAGGAAAGKQVGDFQVSQGKEETSKRDTLMGAGVGFMTWGVGKLATGPASPNLAPRWLGPKSTLKFFFTGRWLGMVAHW